MCRNIKTLFNFEPPATPEEIRAASLQFVRKISGFNRPSKGNAALFHAAVDEIAGVATRLLRSLETSAPPKNREEETAKAKARAERQTPIHHRGTEDSKGVEMDLSLAPS
jgi:hypothetical protein